VGPPAELGGWPFAGQDNQRRRARIQPALNYRPIHCLDGRSKVLSSEYRRAQVFRRRTTANPSTLGIGIAGNNELKTIGRKNWSKRIRQIIKRLGPILNHDVFDISGGNAGE